MTRPAPVKCPLCGADDVTSTRYHVGRGELRVEHSDGTHCEAAPVNEDGTRR